MGTKYYKDAEYFLTMSENLTSMSEEITATVGLVNDAVLQNVSVTAQKSSEDTSLIQSSINDAA